MTKHTKYVDLDNQNMRSATRAYLSEHAKHLLQGMRAEATAAMLENTKISRLEDRVGVNDTRFLFDRERLEELLTTWEVTTGPHYDENYNNEYTKPGYSLDESLSNVETQQFLVEQFGITEAEDKPIEVDVTDEDPTDDNLFIDALKKADEEDTTVQITLDDDSTIDLDQDTIKRLIDDPELVKKSLTCTDNIETFAKALDLGVIGKDDEVEEEPLSEGRVLMEHVYNRMSELAPLALYDMSVEILGEAENNLNKLAAKVQLAENDSNKIVRGKVAQVNRIRNGKLELKATKSDVKGYKIKDGQAVRMSPKEVKKRKIGAKFAAKKRAQQASKIARKRAISMKMRDRRLG